MRKYVLAALVAGAVAAPAMRSTGATSTPVAARRASSASASLSVPRREKKATSAPSRAAFSATLRATPPSVVVMRQAFVVAAIAGPSSISLRSILAAPMQARLCRKAERAGSAGCGMVKALDRGLNEA